MNGLTLSSVYGLIVIGYTIEYGTVVMINVIVAEVDMVSDYLTAIA